MARLSSPALSAARRPVLTDAPAGGDLFPFFFHYQWSSFVTSTQAEPVLFQPVLLIQHGATADLLDSGQFPYLYNDDGKGLQLREARGDEISMEQDDPGLHAGCTYSNIKTGQKEIHDAGSVPYQITAFDFGTSDVHYEALAASRENARAFGMTLLKNGECLPFDARGLRMANYIYGKWAGHQSPYIGSARRLELLSINPTDLEYHNFTHVFFSCDSLPLVISVARWRPYVNEIALADLWIQPGDAIVLPPKVFPPPPPPGTPYEQRRRIIVDLHGNRNSALACWSVEQRDSLHTTTILATDTVMRAEATRPHYHEERHATRHVSRPLICL